MHHIGPRDCVLNGVSFNVALTDAKGKQISFKQVSDNNQVKELNSIKGNHGLGMLTKVFSEKIQDDRAALAMFKTHLKKQYDQIIDKIPEDTLKRWGYQDRKMAKSVYNDVALTEPDMYRALFTHLALILDSDNKDSTEKDKKELLRIMSDAQRPANKCLKRLLGIDLSCGKLQQLLLPHSADTFLQAMCQSESKHAFYKFVASYKDKLQYTGALYELCRYTRGWTPDATLCSIAKGSTVGRY